MEDAALAARRNRRGQQRGRGRFGALYKLLSFVLIAAAILVGCTVFFRVDKVEVYGNQRYTAEQIIQAAEVEERDSLFLLNKFKMIGQLLTRLPYIDDVTMYRKWPDTWVIEVREGRSAAAVEGLGAWWIVNSRGKIVERTDAAGAAAYPAVAGLTPDAPTVGSILKAPEEESMKLQSLLSLLKELDSLGMMEGVDSIDLTAANEIVLGYVGRFTVKLPMSGSDFRPLLRTVDRAVTESLSETDTGVIDATLKEVHFIPSR